MVYQVPKWQIISKQKSSWSLFNESSIYRIELCQNVPIPDRTRFNMIYSTFGIFQIPEPFAGFCPQDRMNHDGSLMEFSCHDASPSTEDPPAVQPPSGERRGLHCNMHLPLEKQRRGGGDEHQGKLEKYDRVSVNFGMIMTYDIILFCELL